MASSAPFPMFALMTQDGLDQIVETRALANRERRDLVKLGCDVRIVTIKTAEQLARIEERN